MPARDVPIDDPVLQDHYGDLMDALGWPPVVADESGVYRFPRDRLVRWVVDEAGVGLNDMAVAFHRGRFSLGEYMAFYRGLGYSLSGFVEVFGEHLFPPDPNDADETE